MERKVNFVVEVKEGREYKETYVCLNEIDVYRDLSHELINKKIHNCTYIKSIKRIPLYDGFQKIIVTYDNKMRRVYTVENN